MTKLFLLRKLSVPPFAFARSECAPALLPALVDREHDESRCLTRRCGPRVPLSRGLVPRAHPISRALASGVRAACDRSSRRALLNRFELRTPLSHTSTIEPNVTLLPPTGPHGEAKRPTHGPRPAPPAPGPGGGGGGGGGRCRIAPGHIQPLYCTLLAHSRCSRRTPRLVTREARPTPRVLCPPNELQVR